MRPATFRGPRPARRTAAWLALTVLAAGAAGCTAATPRPSATGGAKAPAATAAGPAGDAKAPGATVDSGLVKGMVLPLQAYMTGYPSRLAVEQAKRRIQRECMKGLGFDYDPPQPGSYPPSNFDGANMARRYGISVPEEAEKFGYHLAGNPADPPLYEPDKAAGVALTGKDEKGTKATDPRIPDGGCLGESDQKIGRIDESLVNQLNGDSFERSQSDPTVVQVISAWSTCMKAKGYSATSPLTATDQLQNRGSGEVIPAEIASATADIACKRETNLPRIWFEDEVRIQNELIAANQLALTEERDKNTAVVKRASALG